MIDPGADNVAFLPDDDIDGNPRPLGQGPDVGAHEEAVETTIFVDTFESGTTDEWTLALP